MSSPAVPSQVVVDTDVVSFAFKTDTRASLYRRHLDGRQLVISFMTLAELDRWALVHNWGSSRRTRLDAYLQQFTVHPYDRALCREWAAVSCEARKRGPPIQPSDAWIAATARLYGLPLVTHNPRDFASLTGLRVISEVTRP